MPQSYDDKDDEGLEMRLGAEGESSVPDDEVEAVDRAFQRRQKIMTAEVGSLRMT